MTQYEKNPHNNKWKRNSKNDPKTNPKGLVHFIIMNKNNGAKTNTYKDIDYATNKFPFPRNNQ